MKSRSIFLIVLAILLVAVLVFLPYFGIPRYVDGNAKLTPIVFWDILELVIIPFAIAVVAWLLNNFAVQRERVAAEKREQAQITMQKQQYQDSAVSDFLQAMQQLLQRKSDDGYDKTSIDIARAWALATLLRSGKEHKRVVMQFLHGTALINGKEPAISLVGADLSGADLSGLNLVGANLMETNLRLVNLKGARLSDVDLRGADLTDANLEDVALGLVVGRARIGHDALRETKLDGATILPDGRLYDEALGNDQLTRFTRQESEDFWRSTNPESPAYKNPRA